MKAGVPLEKRRLGRTNLLVTELGLGAMDTPQVEEGAETLRLASDLGITFVDTARIYEGSEFLIGQVLRSGAVGGFRLATKTISRTASGGQHDVDRSLRLLGVRKIDLYQLDDVSTWDEWEQVMEEGGALAGLKAARERGLIDHIGISSHSLEVLEAAIGCGELDAVMLEYSAFFPETESLISEAKRRDVGVIAMRPLGGSGRMSSLRTRMEQSDGDVALTPALLLRYVLSNPDVSVAIPGVRFPSRVRQNVQVASGYRALDEDERRYCEEEASRLFR